jgi:hypothetical protein
MGYHGPAQGCLVWLDAVTPPLLADAPLTVPDHVSVGEWVAVFRLFDLPATVYYDVALRAVDAGAGAIIFVTCVHFCVLFALLHAFICAFSCFVLLCGALRFMYA